MTDNGKHADGLDAIVVELDAMIAKLDPEIERLRDALHAKEVERRRLVAMTRAADPTRVVGKPGPKPKLPQHVGAAPETIAAVLEAARKVRHPIDPDIPGSFSAKTLAAALPMNPATVRNGIDALRDSGVIQLVGERQERHDGKGGRKSRIYRVADDA